MCAVMRRFQKHNRENGTSGHGNTFGITVDNPLYFQSSIDERSDGTPEKNELGQFTAHPSARRHLNLTYAPTFPAHADNCSPAVGDKWALDIDDYTRCAFNGSYAFVGEEPQIGSEGANDELPGYGVGGDAWLTTSSLRHGDDASDQAAGESFEIPDSIVASSVGNFGYATAKRAPLVSSINTQDQLEAFGEGVQSEGRMGTTEARDEGQPGVLSTNAKSADAPTSHDDLGEETFAAAGSGGTGDYQIARAAALEPAVDRADGDYLSPVNLHGLDNENYMIIAGIGLLHHDLTV